MVPWVGHKYLLAKNSCQPQLRELERHIQTQDATLLRRVITAVVTRGRLHVGVPNLFSHRGRVYAVVEQPLTLVSAIAQAKSPSK